MANSLKQWIFLFLQFQCLDHEIVETRCSVQSKFNATKGLKRDTIRAPFENLQQIGNVNDDHTVNIEFLHVAVTEANVEVIDYVI